MSTDTDGSPPSVSPPGSGPGDTTAISPAAAAPGRAPSNGDALRSHWLRQEIELRIAANGTSGGGRHAAPEDAEPYVPQFEVGAPRHGVPADGPPPSGGEAGLPTGALGGPSMPMPPVGRNPRVRGQVRPGAPDGGGSARPLGAPPPPAPPPLSAPPPRFGPAPVAARPSPPMVRPPLQARQARRAVAPLPAPPTTSPPPTAPANPPLAPVAATAPMQAVEARDIGVPAQRRAGGTDADPDPPQDSADVSERVRVVLSERKRAATPVRTVEVVQEGTGVGQLLRSSLISAQLTVALRFAAAAGLTLGALPLLFALFPAIGQAEILGLRVPWLLLGILVYPFLLGLGWWHTRTAERVEQNFADHVQD